MHILQILPALNEGGVERGTLEMSREFVRRGHRSTVVSNGGRLVEQLTNEGGLHHLLDVKSKNPLTLIPRVQALRRLLRTVCPDVVHFRSRVPGWLFIFANRTEHLPFVSTVHGFNSVSPYSRVMTIGQRVICPSSSVSAYIRTHYHTPEERIRLIPRGIDPLIFDPTRLDAAFMSEFRKIYGLEGRFVVLSVGRITQLKGYDLLIRATALARETCPQIKTVIVGGTEDARIGYEHALRQRVHELGLEAHVVFTGSQHKLPEIYACGNVLVSANHRKPESFGRSMAEALSMGCPVIATRFGGALDIVRDGIDGWLIAPGDVTQLADRLKQMSIATFRGLRDGALARFSLEQMVSKTLAVYEEVLASHKLALNSRKKSF